MLNKRSISIESLQSKSNIDTEGKDTEKDIIRRLIEEERSKLSNEFISINSNIITKKLLSMDTYKNAEDIYIYMNFGAEVITENIVIDALKSNKKVAIPKITENNMEFYYIRGINDTMPGLWRNTRTYECRRGFSCSS